MLEERLLKIIGIQNEIASAALDLSGVMNLVVRALPELAKHEQTS